MFYEEENVVLLSVIRWFVIGDLKMKSLKSEKQLVISAKRKEYQHFIKG